MRFFGFYDAMPYELGARVRVKDLPRGGMRVNRVHLARYMSACETLTAVPGVETDPFDPSQQVMGGFSLKTDGEWIWPDIAGHLVRAYDFVAPPEFEERVARLGFTAPVLTPRRVMDIFGEVKSELW